MISPMPWATFDRTNRFEECAQRCSERALFRVERGEDPKVGSHPQLIQAASEGIRSAMQTNKKRDHAARQRTVSVPGWGCGSAYRLACTRNRTPQLTVDSPCLSRIDWTS